MKPTWTKVYSGPGYPIDPKKQSERDVIYVEAGWKAFNDFKQADILGHSCVLIGVDPGANIQPVIQFGNLNDPYSFSVAEPENLSYDVEAILDMKAKFDELKPPPAQKSLAQLIAETAIEKMFPTKDKPKCNCLACTGMLGPDDATVLRHLLRHDMLHTEDFQSRLMEIQVKERQSG